jgi:hypothetical protein
MIVEKGQLGRILSGRRTQTRRPVDARDPYYRVRDGRRGQSRSLVKPYEPKVGDRILMERPDTGGSDRMAVASVYVVVTAIRQQIHREITRAEIAVSGYETVAGYKAAWVREHDRDWVRRERPKQVIRAAADGLGIVLAEHLVRFYLGRYKGDTDYVVEVITEGHKTGRLTGATPRPVDAPRVSPTLTAAQLAARFDSRHADGLVWVIEHEVATLEPHRLLAARPGSSQTDYVSSPAQAMGGDSDPGEAVDPETVAKLGQQAALRRQQGVTADWLALRTALEGKIGALEAQHDLTPKDVKYLKRLRYQLEGGDRRFAA